MSASTRPFNIWDDDLQRAKRLEAETPNLFGNQRTEAVEYSRKLKEILVGFNVQGVDVTVEESNTRGVNVQMDIQQDRRDDVQELINKEGYRLL